MHWLPMMWMVCIIMRNLRSYLTYNQSIRKSMCQSTRRSMRKSIQNRFRKGPGSPKIESKSVLEPSRDALWRLKVSPERLGESPARPASARRVPKRAPRGQKGCSGSSGSLLRRPKSRPSCVWKRNKKFCSRGPFVKHREDDFLLNLVDFWRLRKI